MIVRGPDRVLVQGITGKQGTFWTERMQAYGTKIVGGVNPKKAGSEHCGVPVFACAREAMAEGGFEVSVMFIPPLGAKAAALDAIEAGANREEMADAIGVAILMGGGPSMIYGTHAIEAVDQFLERAS